MKDLIEKILKYLPQYFTDFGSIFCGPKTFISQKDTSAEGAFSDALIFLGISMVLVVLMTFPLLPRGSKELWSYVTAIAILCLAYVSLFGAVVRLAWWIVGGRAPAQSFFIIYSYFLGVTGVVVIGFMLLSIGVFKALPGSIVGNVEIAVLGIGFVFLIFWSFITWGAYRNLNGLSKTRSFAALTIFGILSYPVGAIVYLIGAALQLV